MREGSLKVYVDDSLHASRQMQALQVYHGVISNPTNMHVHMCVKSQIIWEQIHVAFCIQLHVNFLLSSPCKRHKESGNALDNGTYTLVHTSNMPMQLKIMVGIHLFNSQKDGIVRLAYYSNVVHLVYFIPILLPYSKQTLYKLDFCKPTFSTSQDTSTSVTADNTIFILYSLLCTALHIPVHSTYCIVCSK